MRRIFAVGFGLSLGLGGPDAFAQLPNTASRSPVRISAVRSADDSPSTVRAQIPAAPGGLPMPPLPPMVAVPMPMPMGTGGTPMQLGQPKSFGPGPNITEVPAVPPSTGSGGGYVPQPMDALPYSGPPTYQPGFAPGMAAPGVNLSPAYGVPVEGAHPTQMYQQSVCQPDSYGFPMPQLDAPLFQGVYPQPGYAAAPIGFGGLLAGGPYCGQNRWWLSTEYLLWFTKSAEFPALVTTSSTNSNGILGNGDTRILSGNGSFGQTLHSGGRFSLGRYFGANQRWSVDGSVFFLGTNGNEFRATSDQFPVVARPFTNLNQNIPFSQIVARPGLSTGGAAVNFENSVWGADVNFRRRLAGTSCSRLDLLAGFRFMELSEDLKITESFARTLPSSDTSIGVPNALSGTVIDRFRTENQFYGATLGLSGEVRRGRWFANLTTKVALGTVYQQVTIEGSQNIRFDTGNVQNFTGGLLAVPGNIGTHTQNKFAVLPEVGFNLGYQLTPHCRMFMGYSLLYLSNAVRPGDQIDTNLDITRIPNFPVSNVTPLPFTRPTVPLKERDFFAQGLNFGLQWRW